MQTDVRTRPTIAAHYWSIYHLDLPDACALAASRGYQGFDLGTGDLGSGPRIDVSRLAEDPGECERIGGILRDHGLVCTDLVAGGIGITDPHREQARKVFQRLAPNVRLLGATGVTLLPGFYPEGEWERSFAAVAEELRWFVEIGGRHGLSVGIEPHLDSVTDSPPRTLRMLEEVPGLTLTLDYSHFVCGGHEQSSVEPLHAHARHMHVRQAAPGRLSAEVAEGVIDFRRVLELLRTQGYTGALATEYVVSSWRGQDQIADTDEENERMREQMAGLIDELWEASAT